MPYYLYVVIRSPLRTGESRNERRIFYYLYCNMCITTRAVAQRLLRAPGPRRYRWEISKVSAPLGSWGVAVSNECAAALSPSLDAMRHSWYSGDCACRPLNNLLLRWPEASGEVLDGRLQKSYDVWYVKNSFLIDYSKFTSGWISFEFVLNSKGERHTYRPYVQCLWLLGTATHYLRHYLKCKFYLYIHFNWIRLYNKLNWLHSIY